MLKRILSLVTALCLLTLLCVPALAEEECDHVFNGDTCTKCGYKCPHETYDVDNYVRKGYEVIAISASEHTIRGTFTDKYICKACGTIFKEQVEEATRTFEHIPGADVEPIPTEDAKETMKLVTYSESTCAWLIKVINVKACAICDRVLSKESEPYFGSFIFDHRFGSDGKCVLCGYVKGAAIPTATPEPTATLEPTATPEPTPTVKPTDAPTQAPTTAPTEKPNAKPGKADVPKTGERSFAPAVAALMLCAAGALLLSRRK